MKKILLISLTVLIAALFMVSCNMEAKIEDGLAILSFQASDTQSKSLTKTNPELDADDFYWFYTAEKLDNTGLKTGATSEKKAVVSGKTGLGEAVGPFSYGLWSFTLYGYVGNDCTSADAKLAYKGTATVSVKSASNNLSVTVEVQNNGKNGTLSLPDKGGIAIVGDNVNADYSKLVEEIVIKNLDTKESNSYYDSTTREFSLKSGPYSVKVSYLMNAVETDGTYTGDVVATETIYVTIVDYLTTYVSGTIHENTGEVKLVAESGIIKGVSKATIAEDKESVDISVNAAPSKTEAKETDTEKTTVTVPKALVTDTVANAKLEVTSYTQAAAATATYKVKAPSEGEQETLVAIGGLDIDLYVNNSDQKTTTFAEGQTLTITTFVSKKLNGNKSYPKVDNDDTTSAICNILVKYSGENGDDGTVTSYNATTGELKFTVNHLSTYHFVDKSAKVYNQTSNTTYSTIEDAISEANSGDTLVLMDCSLSNDTALDNAEKSLNWKVLHNNCPTGDSLTEWHQTSENFASGYGTKLEPYVVANETQFGKISEMSSKKGYYNLDCSLSNKLTDEQINSLDSENIQWKVIHENCQTDDSYWHATSEYFSGGYGTKLEPYMISTKDQFQNLDNYMWDKYGYYKWYQKNDTLDGSNWSDSIYLHGSFDGNGLTINNLDCYMFRAVWNGSDSWSPDEDTTNTYTIKNLTINAKIVSSSQAAAVVRTVGVHNFVMEDVTIHGHIEGSTHVASFIVYGPGQYHSSWVYDGNITFKNCTSDATVAARYGNAVGFIAHPSMSSATGKINLNSSKFTGKSIATKADAHKYVSGNWTNATITDDNTEDHSSLYDSTVNGWKYTYDQQNVTYSDVTKVSSLEISKGNSFVVDAVKNATSALVELVISPGAGCWTGTYEAEKVDLKDSKFTSSKIKYFIVRINPTDVSESGIHENYYDVVYKWYNKNLDADTLVIFTQYDKDGNILKITNISLEDKTQTTN